MTGCELSDRLGWGGRFSGRSPGGRAGTGSTDGASAARPDTFAVRAGPLSKAAAPYTPSSSPAGLADEIHLAVAPFFVGHPDAPDGSNAGSFPHDLNHRMTLAEVRPVGDVALLRYLLNRDSS